MRRLFVIISLGISFAVASYAVIHTTTTDASAQPYIVAFSLAVVVVLVAFRWITAEQGGKGAVSSILTLIPGLVSWSTQSNARSVLFSICILGFSAFAYWLGPYSLHSISISTGTAKYIEINGNKVR